LLEFDSPVQGTTPTCRDFLREKKPETHFGVQARALLVRLHKK